jgi:hypothetical protein
MDPLGMANALSSAMSSSQPAGAAATVYTMRGLQSYSGSEMLPLPPSIVPATTAPAAPANETAAIPAGIVVKMAVALPLTKVAFLARQDDFKVGPFPSNKITQAPTHARMDRFNNSMSCFVLRMLLKHRA